MAIYILFFILNMLMGEFIMHVKSKDRNKNKRIYLFLTTMQYGLLAGFRATGMSYDTSAYEIVFNRVHIGWDNLAANTSWVENGYYVLCLAIKTLGGDFRTLLIISSLFIVASTSIFVYRHSKDVLLSVFFLISFPYFYTSMDIIRHYIALSWVLLGYKYVEEQKLIKYLIFILIGAQFHVFAYLMIPIYFLYKLKWTKLSGLIYVITTALIYFFINNVAIVVTVLIGKSVENYNYWIGSAAGGIKTALMYVVLAVIIGIAYQNILKKNKTTDLALNSTMLLLASAVIYTNARLFIRVLVAMLPIVAISIPDLLCDKGNVVNEKKRFLSKTSIILLGLAYHMYMLLVNWQNVVPYVPYWE